MSFSGRLTTNGISTRTCPSSYTSKSMISMAASNSPGPCACKLGVGFLIKAYPRPYRPKTPEGGIIDIRNEIAREDEVTRLTERQDNIGGVRSERHVSKAKIIDTHPRHNPLVFLADVAQIDDAETLFLREAADLTGVASLVEVLRKPKPTRRGSSGRHRLNGRK